MDFIDKTVRNVTEITKKKWSVIQADPDPFGTQNAWKPSLLSLTDDTDLSVPSLKKYLDGLDLGGIPSTNLGTANVKYHDRIQLTFKTVPSFSPMAQAGESRRIILADIESWTDSCLSAWEIANTGRVAACSEIANLIRDYFSQASTAYGTDPEAISLMYLTVLDLWVCLDKLAIQNQPILLDYEPVFTLSLFEPMLLPRKRHMERLLAAERHITDRQARAISSYPPILNSFGTRSSLAVRYFDQSLLHQNLLGEIERTAAYVRQQKKEELHQKKELQADLEAKADAISCSYHTTWYWNKKTQRNQEIMRHNTHCQKCAWVAKAAALKIDIHEWPLPTSDLLAKAVVFELSCPETISIWRDSTFHVLVDIFTPASEHRDACRAEQRGDFRLRTYRGLSEHYASKSNRLEIASSVKEFVKSHYKSELVATATEDSICVAHAPQYRIYDSKTSVSADRFLGHCEIRPSCVQQLPQTSYRCLQIYVDNTTHSPNEVIANQYICPTDISIHEFLTFGHVRAGHRLQWQNMAVALLDGTLNFSQEETRILLTQAAWEAGPATHGNHNFMREAHAVLLSRSFCMDILHSLSSALTATVDNWQGTTSVQTFIALCLRILSLSPHEEVHTECLDFLAQARRATLTWLRQLKLKLANCEEDSQRSAWTESNLEVALICAYTFEVDSTSLCELLTMGNGTAVLVECAITIHDLCPASRDGLPQNLQQSILRFYKMTHAMESALYKILIQSPEGLNESVTQHWKSHRPGTLWKSAQDSRKEWLVTKDAESPGSEGDVVHFNILTGSLLVNGSPISRLPRSYETHESYRRLFGTVK